MARDDIEPEAAEVQADLVVEEPFDPQAPVDEAEVQVPVEEEAASPDPPDYFTDGSRQGYVGDKPTG